MKKLLLIFLILLGVLIGGILAVPVFFKGKIVKAIQGAVNEELTATVSFDEDIHLSLIRNFPNLSLGIDEIEVVNHGDFEGDTLLRMKKFRATLDIMSVIKGDEIRIRSIKLEEPIIHAHILSDGKANWDITKPSTDTTSEAPTEEESGDFKISLKNYEIKDADILYNDEQGQMMAQILGFTHQGKGDFSKDDFVLETITEIQSLTYTMEGVDYLKDVNTALKMDIGMNLPNMRFDFKENTLRMNTLEVGFDGFIAMPDEAMNMDFKLVSKKTSLKEILSLVPSMYTKDFEQVKADGNTALDLSLNGTYNSELEIYPAFEVKLLVENGKVSYPDLPESLSDIQINLRVNNADGAPDHTVVNLERFHMLFGKEAFDAKLLFTRPISAPYVDLMAKGKVDLGNLNKMIPLDEGTTLTGLLTADLKAKGHVNTFTGDDYEAMDAAGELLLQGLKYTEKETLPYEVEEMQLSFSPKEMTLSKLQGKYGHSDFSANGTMSNYLAYAFKEGEVLNGELNLNSTLFDCNSFLTEEAEQKEQPAPADTMDLEAFVVPANLNLNLNLNLNKVLYDNLTIQPVVGSALVKEQTLYFQGVELGMFEGKVKMDGYYSSKNEEQPETKVKLALQGIDIKESFNYMNTVKMLAPIAENLTGKLNMEMDLKTLLNKDMSPVLASISSDGLLQTVDAVLNGFKPTSALADKLNLKELKSIPLGRTNISYQIQDGKVSLKEAVNLKLDQLQIDVEKDGWTSFDQLINYKMKITVPKALFGNQGNAAIEGLLGEAAKAGMQFNNPEKLVVNALMTGTIKDPKITTSLNEIKEDIVNQVKDEVKKVIEEKKEEVKKKVDDELEKRIQQASAKGDQLIEEAKKQAEALKAEAKKKGEQLVAEAKKKREDLIKEAGINPLKKVAAEKAGDALVDEANKQADKLNAEAAKQGDALIKKAEDEKAKLIEQARTQKDGITK